MAAEIDGSVDEMIKSIFSSDKNTAKFYLPKQNYTKAILNNQTMTKEANR